MGTAERRLSIYRYLCRKRHATIPELAAEFGVSTKTIQRDINVVEYSLHLPLITKAGKYGGGIYVLDTYTPNANKKNDEVRVLKKAHDLLSGTLSAEEMSILERMIADRSRYI